MKCKIARIICKIKREMQEKKLDSFSPNEVNLFAWSIGIEDLTSEEVVFISDNL